MTDDTRLDSGEWHRLEELWEQLLALPADERLEFIRSLDADDSVRTELYSLMSRSEAAAAFFDRLQKVVPETAPDRPGPDDDTPVGRPEEGDPDSLIGAMVNQYRIDAVLGEGGMGVVYRAVDTRLRRIVALKLLRHHDGDARAIDRLIAEARSAAALDHPNICTVHEVGETVDHTWFIAMAYYSGETLDRVLRRGPLPPDIALDYATQIARGLGAAHERGIVHRDVKPANIIVTTDGTVKLLDFGIAQRTDDAAIGRLTPGTIAYMSPEQVASRPVDHRTDLWSLGVVLYELCTGSRPFDRDDVGATIHAIVHDAAPPVTSIRAGIPTDFSAIIQKLLSKAPSRRYSHSSALLADLKPPNAAARTKRRAWRSVTSFVIGGLLLVPWTPLAERRSQLEVPSDQRLAAIDLFSQGNVDVLFRTDSGRRKAVALFEQAIAIDPTYAPPFAALAHMRGGPQVQLLGRSERRAVAEKHARTAIDLDPSLAAGHAALGRLLMDSYLFAEAEASFLRAHRLSVREPARARVGMGPEYSGEFIVWFYVFMDRPREALRYAQLNAKAYPGAPTAIAELARAMMVNGRCDSTLSLLGKFSSLELPPARSAAIAAQCYAQQGSWQKAIDGLRVVAARNPGQPEAWLAYMLARAGQTAEAHEIRDRILARPPAATAYQLVTVYAGLREYDKAFEFLDRAVEDRSLQHSIMEPAFAELRRDPRFDRVRERLGLYKR